MRLEKFDPKLRELAEAVSHADGVIAAILFGSRARGEADEGSDYDMLVVFDSDEKLWGERKRLFERVAESGELVHVIARSVRELREETEPTFIKSIADSGILLYAKYPFSASALLRLEPAAVIKFDLSSLDRREKVRMAYRLYGRKSRPGLIQRLRGERLSPGCVLVPRDAAGRVLEVLKAFNVPAELIEVYRPSAGMISHELQQGSELEQERSESP